MKIGYDAKRYFHNKTGLGNYSRDLVNTVIAAHPEDQFFLFDSKPTIEGLAPNTIAIPPGNGIPFLSTSFLWRPYFMRREMAKYMLNVFHGLSNELPWGKYPAGIKKIVTIHDVIFKHYPDHYQAFDRFVYDKKTAHAVKIADRIIATSRATADDLMRFYKVDASKLHVVYQSCGEGHRQTYADDVITSFRNKHQIPENSFLYLSSFQTRKNHLQLLKAYALYKGPYKLVLAGKPGETLKACKQFINDHHLVNKVVILEGLENRDLPLLYRSCAAFVYPSLIEGFGIPLIEAAQASLPIAVNDIAIFRELAPAGSLFFKADDVQGFARQLEALSRMPKSVYNLFLKGLDPVDQAHTVYEIYGL